MTTATQLVLADHYEELLDICGIRYEDIATQESTISLLGSAIFDSISVALLARLSPDDRSHAVTLFEQGEFPDLGTYLSSRIPHIGTLIQKTAQEELRRLTR